MDWKNSVSATAQFEIGTLLEQAGALRRGSRHDCPKCGGKRTVTHTAECFYCHKCTWKGNAITLQKMLGIYRRLPSAQFRVLCRNRQLAREAAKRLYVTVHARQLELREEIRSLGRLELAARDAGPNNPATWGALVLCYRRREPILRELDTLENCSAAEAVGIIGEGYEGNI